MFHIVLHEPQIAPNTGNIIRISANTGCQLHLIEPLGFDFEEKKLRRAGLDYHDLANVIRYPNYEAFLESMGDHRIFACTTKGSKHHSDVTFKEGDIFLFGSETTGLPADLRDSFPLDQRIRVPMMPSSRSINLANSVSIICYEAWRQFDYLGGV